MNIFRRKPAVPAPVAQRLHAPAIDGARQISELLRRESALQRRGGGAPSRGMWVVYQGRTGILTALEAADIATVMLVDERGCNVLEVHAPAFQLRQAWLDEIPEPRRPNPEHGASLGYHARLA